MRMNTWEGNPYVLVSGQDIGNAHSYEIKQFECAQAQLYICLHPENRVRIFTRQTTTEGFCQPLISVKKPSKMFVVTQVDKIRIVLDHLRTVFLWSAPVWALPIIYASTLPTQLLWLNKVSLSGPTCLLCITTFFAIRPRPRKVNSFASDILILLRCSPFGEMGNIFRLEPFVFTYIFRKSEHWFIKEMFFGSIKKTTALSWCGTLYVNEFHLHIAIWHSSNVNVNSFWSPKCSKVVGCLQR